MGVWADSPDESLPAGRKPLGGQARHEGHTQSLQVDPFVRHAVDVAGHLLERIEKEHLTC